MNWKQPDTQDKMNQIGKIFRQVSATGVIGIHQFKGAQNGQMFNFLRPEQ